MLLTDFKCKARNMPKSGDPESLEEYWNQPLFGNDLIRGDGFRNVDLYLKKI